MNTLVARINALEGWTCELRGNENVMGSAVHAVVYPVDEEKKLANSDTYICTYRIEVLIVLQSEDADATLDGSNGYRYLDRMVAACEEVVHAPDTWGDDPLFTDVWVTGHDMIDPDDDNEMLARVSLTFRYRHSYLSPSTP